MKVISDKGKSYYKHKFQDDWDTDPKFAWLKRVNDDDTKAFCIHCKKELNANKLNLDEHYEKQHSNLKTQKKIYFHLKPSEKSANRAN